MLDPVEEAAVAEQFGVASAQVRRDHLISHLLAALSPSLADELVFLGGTALARSLVADGRLSEDIDLLAIGRRRDVVGAVERQLVQGVRREYPGLRWEPPLSAVRDVQPAVLRAPDGTTVRVQLLGPTGVAPWPVELRELVQRYSDAPPARLRVPTARRSRRGRRSRGWTAPPPATFTTSGHLPGSVRSTGGLWTCSCATDQPTGHPLNICSSTHPMRPGGAVI